MAWVGRNLGNLSVVNTALSSVFLIEVGKVSGKCSFAFRELLPRCLGGVFSFFQLFLEIAKCLVALTTLRFYFVVFLFKMETKLNCLEYIPHGSPLVLVLLCLGTHPQKDVSVIGVSSKATKCWGVVGFDLKGRVVTAEWQQKGGKLW